MVPDSFDEVLRAVLADNPGEFTLDGTRTYIVGRRSAAVIDPGPDVESHVRAVVRSVEDADEVVLLLTHGHGDHAGATDPVLEELGRRGVACRVAGAGHPRAAPLADGDRVETDAGSLVAVATPGHTPEHLSYHWPGRAAVFPGDLVLGRGDTTWVAGYPGCVADYLASLDAVRRLDPDILFPTHGPPLADPGSALDRFEDHRRSRVAQVEEALGRHPAADPEELVDRIYGDRIPRGMRRAALESVRALLDHVRAGEGSD